MSNVDDIADRAAADSERKKNRYHFDRHTPEYREQFEKITEEFQRLDDDEWSKEILAGTPADVPWMQPIVVR